MSKGIDRVIVTGASSGIGLDIARRFLRAGSSVLINGRNPDKLAQVERSLEGGERVIAVPGDITEPSTAEQIAAAARTRWGGVDVLVNCAGIFWSKPFLETSDEDLERFLATNVKGTFRVTRALVPLMIADGGGSIINIGSVLVALGKRGAPVSGAMVSKGGVHALTVSLAAELAPHGIRVNTLAPGIVRTPLIEDADSLAGWHALGRVAEVHETSDAAFYLATAGFVTGTVHNLDGGYSSVQS